MAIESARRILSTDDVDFTARLIERFLGAHGYVVEIATSGKRALAMIEADPFDLVLLDIVMPEMDGLAVLRQIRKRYSMTELPVIMLTGLTESKDVVNALGLGANDYINKPLDGPVVLARVETHLALADMTKQLKLANRTIREKSDHLQMVMDGATSAIFSLDNAGSVTSANEKTAEITGVAVEDLIGSLFDIVVAEAARPDFEDMLTKVTREGFLVTNHETAFRRPDGEERTVDLSLRALHREGVIVGVAGIATDATDVSQQRDELAAYVRSLDAPDPRLLALLEPPKGKLLIDDGSPAAMASAEGGSVKLAGIDKSEQRVHQRHRVFKGAKLYFNNDMSVMDCVVRNMSEGGARLQFEADFDCPRFVTLKMSEGATYDCEVRQFANAVMGVKFLKRRS